MQRAQPFPITYQYMSVNRAPHCLLLYSNDLRTHAGGKGMPFLNTPTFGFFAIQYIQNKQKLKTY